MHTFLVECPSDSHFAPSNGLLIRHNFYDHAALCGRFLIPMYLVENRAKSPTFRKASKHTTRTSHRRPQSEGRQIGTQHPDRIYLPTDVGMSVAEEGLLSF